MGLAAHTGRGLSDLCRRTHLGEPHPAIQSADGVGGVDQLSALSVALAAVVLRPHHGIANALRWTARRHARHQRATGLAHLQATGASGARTSAHA